MKRQNMNFLIICLIFMASYSALAQSISADRTSCSNLDKKRWLVKKGVMTKSLCLSTQDDNLKVNIIGELFKLGSESYNLMTFTAKSGICPPKVDEDLTGTANAKAPVPRRSMYARLSRFRTFLKLLHVELTNRNSKKPTDKRLREDQLKYDISATGYADGVRNLRAVFDSEIKQILKNRESLDYKELSKYLSLKKITEYNNLAGLGAENKVSYPLTPEGYTKIACHPHLSDDKKVYFGKIPTFIYKNFLTPLRNIRLANARASTLVNAIFNKTELQKYSKNEIRKNSKYPLPAKIKIANSSKINTGIPICYGYCEGFRGAKVDIKIPTLKEVVKLEKNETVSFPLAFNTPSSSQQIRFNKIAMDQFFKDVTDDAKSNDYSTGFKALLTRMASGKNPIISIVSKPPEYTMNMTFPNSRITKVEKKFFPNFSIMTAKENPFRADTTIQNKLNKELFTYLSANYNKNDKIVYKEQDRKFITKYLAKRFKTSETKIKAQKELLNWAIIIYWSRFGSAMIKEKGLEVTIAKKRPYIDSLFAANLEAPGGQKLLKIFAIALKDQGVYFYNSFKKELKRYTRLHNQNSILGKVFKSLSYSYTHKKEKMSALYRKYYKKDDRGYDKPEVQAERIINKYYPAGRIIMHKKKSGSTVLKTPVGLVEYAKMINSGSSNNTASSESYIVDPANHFTPDNLKIFNSIFKETTFNSWKLTKLKTGSEVADAIMHFVYSAQIIKLHARSIEKKCFSSIKYRSRNGSAGNYYTGDSTKSCTFLDELAKANNLESMKEVIVNAFKNPPFEVRETVEKTSSGGTKKVITTGYAKQDFDEMFNYSPVSSYEVHRATFNKMNRYYAQYMLNMKKSIEAKYGKMQMTSKVGIAKSIPITNIKKVLTEKETAASVEGGNDSTIFSFLDYDKAYSSHYKSYYKNPGTFIALPMTSPLDIDSIYYTPDSISSGEEGYKGFFHNACHTGVMFKMKPGTTSFIYQSRLKVRSSSYSTASGTDGKSLAMKAFDNSWKLGIGSSLSKYDYFNIIRLKHPTAYLLNSCEECACLGQLAKGKTLKEIINKNLVKSTISNKIVPAIMNFSRGFTWVTTKSKKKKPVKKFILKNLIGKNISAKDSKNYCIITPLVPQTHYVGVGSAKESKFTPDASSNDNISPEPCPIISVLDQKNSSSKKPIFSDVVKNVQQQDKIIDFCKNVSNNYPYANESICLTKKNNDICSFLDEETQKKYPNLCGKKLYGEALWNQMQKEEPESGKAFCNML